MTLVIYPSDLQEDVLHGLSDDDDVHRRPLVLREASGDVAQMIVGAFAVGLTTNSLNLSSVRSRMRSFLTLRLASYI